MTPKPEEDRLLEHNYDGIQEYDNPMPRWWLLGLYGTIIWGVLYVLNIIPGIGSGKGWDGNYEQEMIAAKQKYGDFKSQAMAGMDSSTLMAKMQDAAQLAAAKETFLSTCSPCHVADGGGLIGPNLTDEYWISGGSPMQIMHALNNGVLEKGMPAWSAVYNPDQIAGLVAYVMSLQGTTPAAPKAPQGMKADGTAAETPAPAQ